MTLERSDLDLGGVLGAWMNDAAPAAIPTSSSRRRSPGR